MEVGKNSVGNGNVIRLTIESSKFVSKLEKMSSEFSDRVRRVVEGMEEFAV